MMTAMCCVVEESCVFVESFLPSPGDLSSESPLLGFSLRLL